MDSRFSALAPCFAPQGYDVVAFTEGGKRKATGLDISDTALTRAREVGSSNGSSNLWMRSPSGIDSGLRHRHYHHWTYTSKGLEGAVLIHFEADW